MHDDDDGSIAALYRDFGWILTRAMAHAAYFLTTNSPRTPTDEEIRHRAPGYTWRAIDELTADLDEFEYHGREALLSDIINKQREMIETDYERGIFNEPVF